jgi:hypothetical protein
VQELDGIWRTPKAKIEKGRVINEIIGPDLKYLEGPVFDIVKANSVVEERKYDDLALPVTMKTSLADLGIFAGKRRCVLMMDKQVMEYDLGRHAEGKDKRH